MSMKKTHWKTLAIMAATVVLIIGGMAIAIYINGNTKEDIVKFLLLLPVLFVANLLFTKKGEPPIV